MPSISENQERAMGRADAQNTVRALYEDAPYPDLGAALKDPSDVLGELMPYLGRSGTASLAYLEAGCGTGHFLVGVAKEMPNWHCVGIDLSSAAIGVAGELAKKHGCAVELHQKSYLDELPFPTRHFDIISAQGTIHHCDDPVGALRNLKRYLKDDGVIAMHVYGMRLDAGKFDLKEAISIFQPDLFAHDERFRIFRALIDHKKRRDALRTVLDTSLLDIVRWVRKILRNALRRSKSVSWSPPWTDVYETPTGPWKDHFCHPCERAYEVPDIRALVEGADLKIIAMRAQGRVDISLVPPELRDRFAKLDPWDQWRLMELLAPARSFSLFMGKA